ncbi:hypothetical protein AB4037_24590 [Labrys sp. KB_33_2]|uniref:hypothetical protein n=1 Tax=Labrys sp. KB_33_2 TaxID=3237479 RepID=UPI003F8F919D
MKEFVAATSAATALQVSPDKTVADMALAKALGYAQPKDFRKLIKRHLPALEAMGLVRHAVAPIISGKGRISSVTEYHLNQAQVAFLVGKAGTKRADSLAIAMAEVFALFADGGLVAADERAAKELADIAAREARRRHDEEREARDMGFRALRGRW